MDSPGCKVRLADWERDQAGLRTVRTRVFVEEQAVTEREEWDGLDPECVHAVAESPGEGIIGTGRLHPSGKIGRMAVLAPWRGRGVGAAILGQLLQAAAERGLTHVYLHAQVPVIGFYARHGFVAEGPEFVEADIPHRLMNLARPGAVSPTAPEDGAEGTRRLLSGKSEFAVAVADVAATAARSLAIYTPDLEHGVYDSPRFLEAVKRLVLSRSHARIRVMISDPGRVQNSMNRFLYVGRRLSTFIEFRCPPGDVPTRGDAFMIADASALVYRARAERWEGLADTCEPRMARHYLTQFEEIWYRGESAGVLRELRV
jgi:predicted GNAT family N-acyltransferase